MNERMPFVSRVLLLVAAVLMVISMFIPWWGLRFWAPQYPEGLDIIVYPTKLEGDIDIINGLNHYIGMAPFSQETFPEFAIFPYVIILATILIIAVAIINKRLFYWILLGLALAASAIGLYRMYYWLSEFGTNLDPMAPIDIEPFVPPIIGPNTIANFETFSNFRIGGWLIFIVVVLIVIAPFLRKK